MWLFFQYTLQSVRIFNTMYANLVDLFYPFYLFGDFFLNDLLGQPLEQLERKHDICQISWPIFMTREHCFGHQNKSNGDEVLQV